MAVNEFETDTHRRVAGMLMRPRTAAEIAEEFRRHDPYVNGEQGGYDRAANEVIEPTGAYTTEGVEDYLKDLEADGLAKNIGTFDNPKDALDRQDGDKALINFDGSRKEFKALAESELKWPFLQTADHWVRTIEAQDRLVGEAPGSENADE